MFDIDEAFIKRVYRTSAYVWGFVALVLLSFGSWWGAAGWSLGAIVSAGVLWSLEWIVRRVFVPDNLRAKSALQRFTLIKIAAGLPILGIAVWASTHSVVFIFAFCAGVVLTQAVIFLKVVGMLICQHFND